MIYIVRGVLWLHLLLTVTEINQRVAARRHHRHLLRLLSEQIRLLAVLVVRIPKH
jgi:hypothetical protein